ncbi:MAG: hypothetical protein ACRCUI_14315, partial [Polymorphobacter sp.]
HGAELCRGAWPVVICLTFRADMVIIAVLSDYPPGRRGSLKSLANTLLQGAKLGPTRRVGNTARHGAPARHRAFRSPIFSTTNSNSGSFERSPA